MNLLLNSVANGANPKWYFYVGIVAAIMIAVFTLPQLISILKHKDTSGVSIPMYIILCTGNFLFALNGIGILTNFSDDLSSRLSGGLPLFLANFIACVIATTILIIKIRNKIWAKRRGITEKQLADNFNQINAEEKEAKMLKKSEGEL